MAHEIHGRTWPTLFKFAKSGAIQQWEITAIEYSNGTAAYEVEYGQQGGKIQVALVEVNEGKNLGKTNETTPYEQAISEAKAKWKLQQDKGYCAGVPKVLPRTDPMLAHKYRDKADKVTFPCYWQPKLDGIRCIAYRDGEDITLISRRGKEFDTLNHIKTILLEIMNHGDIFDGELYAHGVAFQKVVSWIKRAQPKTKDVMYNVYDMVNDDIFRLRFDRLCKLIGHKGKGVIKTVYTSHLNSHAEVKTILAQQEARGFEGIMLRVGYCKYQCGRRSSELLKVKTFIDQEFEIIGAEENKGRQKSQCTFVCKTDTGTTFKCKPMGTDAERKEYWTNKATYIGQMLTVRFFEWTTSDNPVPRFPIGVSVREEWD